MPDDSRAPGERRELDERPPFFRTWWPLYAVVLGTLAALVLLFTLLTHVFGQGA